MQPVYKQVKGLMPHCPKCGEQLSGNGSRVLPLKCKCGVWKKELGTEEFVIEENF